MTTDVYYTKIQQYNNLKNSLNYIITHLNKSIGCASNISALVGKNYSINESVTTLLTSCNGVQGDISSIVDYLSGTVIPAIDGAIAGCKAQIVTIETQG